MSRKKYYDAEKLVKGIANHRRLEMLEMINKMPNMSGEEIIEKLKINYQTGSSHLQKLVRSGLVQNHRFHQSQLYTITPFGSHIIKLLIKS